MFEDDGQEVKTSSVNQTGKSKFLRAFFKNSSIKLL